MSTTKGFILWEGPSVLDGKPIAVIATKGSKNKKTGGMIQTYIIRTDLSPVEATKNGEDVSICGECPHRKQHAGSCYVRVEQGPLIVYKAYKRGTYPRLHMIEVSERLHNEKVRLGTYGDPASVPLLVWRNATQFALAITGYTHQWRTAELGLAVYCMASCDTYAETREAQARGWRTFTVVNKGSSLLPPPNSFLCPASEEGGKKLTCEECLACGGSFNGTRNASVYIPVHGVAYKVERFNLITIGKAQNHGIA